jgi:hypothetical protein
VSHVPLTHHANLWQSLVSRCCALISHDYIFKVTRYCLLELTDGANAGTSAPGSDLPAVVFDSTSMSPFNCFLSSRMLCWRFTIYDRLRTRPDIPSQYSQFDPVLSQEPHLGVRGSHLVRRYLSSAYKLLNALAKSLPPYILYMQV